MISQEEHSLIRPTVAFVREHFLNTVITESRSPAGNSLGFTLREYQPGLAIISMPVAEQFTNPYGNIHGGAMSLFIDEAIGWSVVSLEAEHFYTSLNLSVDFLYAAAKHEVITARAEIVRKGKKIVHAACEVRNAEGVLLARASSNLIAISERTARAQESRNGANPS